MDQRKTSIVIDLIWKLAEAEGLVEDREVDGQRRKFIVADRNWLTEKMNAIKKQVDRPN